MSRKLNKVDIGFGVTVTGLLLAGSIGLMTSIEKHAKESNFIDGAINIYVDYKVNKSIDDCKYNGECSELHKIQNYK